MKFFTLSAICVLCYCLLLALSGVSGLTGDELKGLENPRVGNHQSALLNPKDLSVEIAKPHPGPPVKFAPEWKYTASDTQIENERKFGRQVRTFGILFILGWVVISFKLLGRE